MVPGKLFIGGISWDTNEDRLRDYFHTFGEVLEAVIMKDRNTGRARGFGFVIFADPTVAETVVREKHMIDGRTVEAKKAVPRDCQHVLNRNNGILPRSPSPARTKKIFVGGLASTVTENDFKKYFDQFGTIIDVVVMYDHNTQRPRGFGFITYDSEEAVEKVLLKAFHDLNGKMVEVKRAVPKELSPGSSRNLLGGYNPALSRVSNLLNAYTQGYNPSSVGGYGLRVNGKSSPGTVHRSGCSSFSPGYGMGLNFENELSPSYVGSGTFSSNFGYGPGLNPFYSGSPNKYDSPVGHSGDSGETGSLLSLTNRNMWGNGSRNYTSSTSNPIDFVGFGSGSTGLAGSFGSIEAIWGSNISGQAVGTDSTYHSGNLSYGNMDNSFQLGVGGYRRNSGSSVAATSSYAASSDGLDAHFGNFHGGDSFHGDPTQRSLSSELDGSGFFDYGLRKVASDVTATNSAGYVGGYAATDRANRDPRDLINEPLMNAGCNVAYMNFELDAIF